MEKVDGTVESLKSGAATSGCSMHLNSHECAVLRDLIKTNGLEPKPVKPEVFEFTGANLLVTLEEIVVELYQALGNNEQANKYFMFECVDIIKYVLSGALREDFRTTTIEEPALGWIPGYMAERKKWREERELRQWAESMEHQLALAYSGQADDDEIPF